MANNNRLTVPAWIRARAMPIVWVVAGAVCPIPTSVFYALSLFPAVAQAANTKIFEAFPTGLPTFGEDIDTAVNQAGGLFFFNNWIARGMTIRSGNDVRMCLANLAKALDEVGVLSSSEYNGAAGALSLLPTAGALLGAPTREMWIVYKLIPLSGILSMFLSLGATITPSEVGEYDPAKTFSYGGMMPTSQTEPKAVEKSEYQQMEEGDPMTEPLRFANDVRDRAEYDGGQDYIKIWIAVFCQLVLIGIVLVAMWYAQQGAVITWWCRVWGWMYFWWALIVIVSVFDNVVAAPFSKSWKIRVSKAPTGVRMAATASRATSTNGNPTENIIKRLSDGFNQNHRITMADEAAGVSPRTCFYVVISIQKISSWHAALQVLSRACSVAVFAFGTALFASATLMSISAALMLLCLILPCGVMGRVVAMWIAKEMNQPKAPAVMHRVVPSEKIAGLYLIAILDTEGLLVETMGQVFIDGVYIERQSPLFSAATYIGLLAKPYDVYRKATKNHGFARTPSELHRLNVEEIHSPKDGSSNQSIPNFPDSSDRNVGQVY